jgi:hypothetical protein
MQASIAATFLGQLNLVKMMRANATKTTNAKIAKVTMGKLITPAIDIATIPVIAKSTRKLN